MLSKRVPTPCCLALRRSIAIVGAYRRSEEDTRRSKTCSCEGALTGLLIVAILVISTAPLYAQRQQHNAKLKADARDVVGTIGADKDKAKTYCQLLDLERLMNQAVGEKDQKKARAFAQNIVQLQKQLGPELVTLGNIFKHVDLNSPDGRKIAAIIQSCFT